MVMILVNWDPLFSIDINWRLKNMKKFKKLFVICIAFLFIIAGCGQSQTSDEEKKPAEKTEPPKDMILATTTSTQDSGLLDVLKPEFEKQANVNVKIIAVGTGQALEMGTKGEADALLVHAPKSEEAVVASGDAINRKRVMYNDFIVVGPKSDPAGVKGLDTKQAFTKIFETKSTFCFQR